MINLNEWILIWSDGLISTWSVFNHCTYCYPWIDIVFYVSILILMGIVTSFCGSYGSFIWVVNFKLCVLKINVHHFLMHLIRFYLASQSSSQPVFSSCLVMSSWVIGFQELTESSNWNQFQISFFFLLWSICVAILSNFCIKYKVSFLNT